jgi:hypothetical protein
MLRFQMLLSFSAENTELIGTAAEYWNRYSLDFSQRKFLSVLRAKTSTYTNRSHKRA